MIRLLELGLANWWATKLVVESELFRPARNQAARWYWTRYLSACWACVGTWIALAEGAANGPVIHDGVVGLLLTSLAIAAVGHLILELRPQAWWER